MIENNQSIIDINQSIIEQQSMKIENNQSLINQSINESLNQQ